jgi:hypothetical protein
MGHDSFQEVPLVKSSRRRFYTALLAFCLAILAGLPGLACAPRKVPDVSPVEERPVVAAPPQAVFASPPPDQASATRFERITVEDGLSQNAVLTIAQDRRGFMWFGTEDGLNKYDGYQFTVYKHDPEDPDSLSSSDVRVIYEDRKGTLQKEGGLTCRRN